MGNLREIIEKGEIIVPSNDSSELFKNITDNQLEELSTKGEVVVSDGHGNAFLIRIPTELVNTNKIPSKDQILITKIPYAANQREVSL